MIIVELADPRTPAASALLKQSHALMESLFPPEENFYLDIDAICADHIDFFTARDGDTVLGTAALAYCGDYGEVKSMYVDEAARDKGVGAALLRQVEDAAREKSLPILKLETGDKLHAAHRLYRRHGFVDCGPFGDYFDAGSSVFMEKPLD
ncbi:GNAT family N-acetyltransferase [Cognatiyoonia sp.]|uniref:GNAT family N-acetyltransferase n=1 Tax=Cognatiyoonia sp. TaxID=2211652 RepID=UPI003F69EC28